jgi:hypothetical protein
VCCAVGQIRKSVLDRSIRDGDLLSLEGFTLNSPETTAPPPELLDLVGTLDFELPDFEPQPSSDMDPIKLSSNMAPSGPSMAPSGTMSASSTPSSKKKKRQRSLSSKFWLVNKLAQSGKITYGAMAFFMTTLGSDARD